VNRLTHSLALTLLVALGIVVGGTAAGLSAINGAQATPETKSFRPQQVVRFNNKRVFRLVLQRDQENPYPKRIRTLTATYRGFGQEKPLSVLNYQVSKDSQSLSLVLFAGSTRPIDPDTGFIDPEIGLKGPLSVTTDLPRTYRGGGEIIIIIDDGDQEDVVPATPVPDEIDPCDP
jgi:hypothetical protein